MSTPKHLDPSELGTKEYWNALYTRELQNNTADPSDTGTTWFDSSSAEQKMASFLSTSLPSHQRACSLLDLGSGNGSLLLHLRDKNFSGRALGVDYSPHSVALARQVAAHEEPQPPVDFVEWDIMGGPYGAVLNGDEEAGWDVVLDKGTFDAISLSDERDGQGRRLCELYPGRIEPLVKKGGIFLVTSCNWTEEELTKWFVGEEEEEEKREKNSGFVVDGRVQYRTFSFGGVKGQTISTLCFRRV